MLPKLRSEAPVVASTLDVDARTVEVIFYSGASVQRFPFFDDPYELAFSLDKGSVRMGRFNAGAPLVDNHRDDLPVSQAVIGVVEAAWLAADGGHARVKIAEDRPDILARLRDGILRNFSMGAVIHTARDVTKKGDSQKRMLAVDWEPMELSIVPVPADSGAQVLAQAEKFPCELSGALAPKGERNMDKIKVRLLADVKDVGKLGEIVEIEKLEFDSELHTRELKKAAPSDQSDDRAEDLALADALASDTKRVARLREIATHYELDDLWVRRHQKLGSTVTEALAAAKKLVQTTDAGVIDSGLKFGEDYQSLGWAVARMSDALSARALKTPCPAPAQQYARMSLAECAYGVLEKLGQTRGRALDPIRAPYDVIKLAMSNADFPNILANVLNKSLLERYQTANPSFRMIAAKRDFKDYRAHKFIRSGDFPLPLLIGEGGEITQGSMGEGSESITALKYGRIMAILWEVLVNDDLSAFGDFGGMVARRITDFENATFYSRVITTGSGLGQTMSDAVACYNAAHTNVNSAGALDNTRLEEAFGLMAAQTSINGLKLNVPGRFVLTSPTSHILARRLLSPIYAAQASNVNAFSGLMEPIFDANLSSVRYYVLADPAVGSNYVYGTIGGSGPRFEVRPGFEVEGVQVKVAHDFGAGTIDFRYGVTGAGA
jgi:hypothetical protein